MKVSAVNSACIYNNNVKINNTIYYKQSLQDNINFTGSVYGNLFSKLKKFFLSEEKKELVTKSITGNSSVDIIKRKMSNYGLFDLDILKILEACKNEKDIFSNDAFNAAWNINDKGVCSDYIPKVIKGCYFNDDFNLDLYGKTLDFIKNGFKNRSLINIMNICKDDKGKFDDKIYRSCIDLKKLGFSTMYVESIAYDCKHGRNGFHASLNSLLDLRSNALDKKVQLKAANKKLDNDDIDLFFAMHAAEIIETENLLGKATILDAYHIKLDSLTDLVRNCYLLRKELPHNLYEALLEKLNPESCEHVKELKLKINELKKLYPKGNVLELTPELIRLENSINENQKQLNNLFKISKSLSPQEKLDKVNVIFAISKLKDENEIKKFINLINTPSEINNRMWKKSVYYKIFENIGIPYDDKTSEKLNLINSKYLDKIFTSNSKFLVAFKALVKYVKSKPLLSVKDALNRLPQNIETKRQFSELGIDYDRWVNPENNGLVKVETKLSTPSNKKYSNQLIVSQADMNNISHSLFLGNHASCCTSVGSGCFQDTAPYYIMNKAISAIEVADGNNFVGNSMCYIAKVDGIPSLILDNIELNSKYFRNNDIRDGFYEYAKQFASKIGNSDMPVYASSLRNAFDMKTFPLHYYDNIKIIGSTGSQGVYIDLNTGKTTINGKKIEKAYLYKIR